MITQMMRKALDERFQGIPGGELAAQGLADITDGRRWRRSPAVGREGEVGLEGQGGGQAIDVSRRPQTTD